MIEKELLLYLSKNKNIANISMLEKDLYLQELLIKISENPYCSNNFAFKGGTCLTKAYFGYYRFSEDLDFTWINTKTFEKQNNNQVRKVLSIEINQIAEIFTKIASEIGLDFKPEKSNKHYIQLGGSNRFVTFKFWYKSVNLEPETFIKIQLNFVEKLFYPIQKIQVKAIAEESKKDIQFLFPNSAKPAICGTTINCYSLEEITAEKIRALLTRRGFKARDIIDLYMLSKKGINIDSIKKIAIEKTLFMLKYLKYAENLKNKEFDKHFAIGNEQTLLIKPLEKQFEAFANKTLRELNELAEEIKIDIK